MKKTNNKTSPTSILLEKVYNRLGYTEGVLLNAVAQPESNSKEYDHWLEKGEWLTIAAKVGAEKIFFVDNDPVIVFCEASTGNEENLLNIFRQVWCIGRPQCFFIATPGELKVFSLNQPPVQNIDEWRKIQPLDVIHKAAEVNEKLHAYRREQVESGQLFIEKDFGHIEQRADKRLILDLKAVRESLLNIKPKINPGYIHALIGRSIFVRYLEDRGVLTPEYFQEIANNRNYPNWSPEWSEVLQKPDERDVTPHSEYRRYTRVLRNKDFTYGLFHQLAEHFNGDMFPRDPSEEAAITQKHLNLLRGFLLGDTDPNSPKLFLWAYDFEIIPIELISSIYEEFYHKSSEKDSGTHYTPGVLVEYVLSQVLTPNRLATKPKILDFACGSAIFLVQAFQRIVRYQESQLKRRLTAQELRDILRTQITGIEINEEAIHVAAFSLYLALLNYQEPKSILAQIEQTGGKKPLPFLIYDAEQIEDDEHYPVLFRANSFSLMNSEREYIKQKLDESTQITKSVEFKKLYDSPEILPFDQNSFDVIVGNPPWGYLKKGEGTPELRTAQEQVLRWCRVFDWSIGDQELSQAFIGRTLNFLKQDGECGLLVSEGVFHKQKGRSHDFRKRWLSESIIIKIVSFSHVRHLFFSGADSPFSFVQFKIGKPNSNHRVQYWSAKKTDVVNKVQSVVLTLSDIHRVRQAELCNNDLLWNVYWWGNHRDAALISTLQSDKSLRILAEERNWENGQGYTSGSKEPPKWPSKLKELPPTKFYRYGEIDDKDFETGPKKVYRQGVTSLYMGWRLLVKQGITQRGGANGRIDARLENKDYCFKTSIQGIKLDNAKDWERKILTGILWSSIARYFLFMTAYSWRTWHNQIHFNLLMNLPVRFPNDINLRQQIIQIVDDLRNWNPVKRDLLYPEGLSEDEIEGRRKQLEKHLDEAIFKLYDLTEAERDLVLDMCKVGLEFFYREDESNAIKKVANWPIGQGTIVDLPADRNKERGLEGYLYAFLQLWNQELESINGEFRWRIIRPPRIPMLAVIFSTQSKGEPLSSFSSTDDEQAWYKLLKRLDTTLDHPVSSRIYIEGMVRAVTDKDIFIIKRNERKLWTRSLAREDAEATLLQAMIIQETRQEIG
jgi:hypothetical protein